MSNESCDKCSGEEKVCFALSCLAQFVCLWLAMEISEEKRKRGNIAILEPVLGG